jgi:hypothetical protein
MDDVLLDANKTFPVRQRAGDCRVLPILVGSRRHPWDGRQPDLG